MKDIINELIVKIIDGKITKEDLVYELYSLLTDIISSEIRNSAYISKEEQLKNLEKMLEKYKMTIEGFCYYQCYRNINEFLEVE